MSENQSTNLKIEALPNSRVRLNLVDGAISLRFEFDSVGGSFVAAQILRAATDSFIQSGAPIPNFTQDQSVWAVASTTAFSLGPSQIPNHESLLLQFGDALLAIPIEKNRLRSLGESLVALSASSETHGH